MTKSTNDNMMTRPQLRVFWQPQSPRLHTVMVWETEVPSGVQGFSPGIAVYQLWNQSLTVVALARVAAASKV